MNTIIIRLSTPLRRFCHGASEVSIKANNVADALHTLGDTFDGILEPIISSKGEIHPFTNIFVGGKNISSQQGLKTPTAENDVILIIVSVAGG